MPFIAGIDEVGYGPRLGPFVVCGVAFEAERLVLPPDPPVADSKRLFSQARGIGSIEPTALAYLRLLWPVRAHSELWRRLSDDPREAPWYGDLELPPSGPLRLPRGVRMAGAWARILEPAVYNARVGSNKAELLFECAADLVKKIHAACPGRVDVAIGRQGGRRFYVRHIAGHFGLPMVREESRGRSCYEIPRGTLTFLVDGEDRHAGIALASVIGKYVRELSMRLFNEWWSARLGVRPTAGYGTDGARFWREIEPHLAAHHLDRDAVLRRR